MSCWWANATSHASHQQRRLGYDFRLYHGAAYGSGFTIIRHCCWLRANNDILVWLTYLFEYQLCLSDEVYGN